MQDLEHLKLINVIKQHHTYKNHGFVVIIYVIETTDPTGKKYAELWRTYNNYGDVSLLFGVQLEDYLKDCKRWEDQATDEAIADYIKNDLTY